MTHRNRRKDTKKHSGKKDEQTMLPLNEADTPPTPSTTPEKSNLTDSTAHLQGAHLDITMLETWLWEAACSIRTIKMHGPTKH